MHDFVKDILEWTTSLHDVITQLGRWAVVFGRVIGLGQPHTSEALYLFTDILSSQISPISTSLDTVIRNILLPQLSRLLGTTAQPLLLIEHMHALRPQHLQLLDTSMSKARPPNSLAEASRSYLALEAQLLNELPRYIKILERGFAACLRQFADWQARFWKEVRGQWVELWDALSVEGDMTAGAADTIKVWRERWDSIDTATAKLGITKPSQDRPSYLSQSPGPTAALATAFALGPTPYPTASLSPPASRFRRHSIQTIDIDLNMQLLDGGPVSGSSASGSPDSFHSFADTQESPGTTVSPPNDDARAPWRNGNDKTAITRRESERLPNGRRGSARQSHLDGGRLPVVQVKSDKPLPVSRSSLPRVGLRPATARRDWEKPDILKKKSLDSAASFSRPSPRASVHTSSSSSSLANHRLSMQSIDVHIGMDMHATQRPPSRASRSDPVSGTSRVPMVRLTPNEPSSSASGKKIPLLQSDNVEPRGRVLKKLSIHKRFTDVFRSPSRRPAVRTSAQSLSVPDHSIPPPLAMPPLVMPSSPTADHAASPTQDYPQVAMYTCTVVHPFLLPLPSYRDFPFLMLQVEDKVEILSEEGHPQDHKELPIRPVDENIDDCLLLARDDNGTVGWALASCLVVLTR